MTTQAGRHRGAWLEIDLDAVRHNVDVIRGLVGPRSTVAPVVKADAYGHGLDAVAGALADRVDALCVATLQEALVVRRSSHGRVLLLYPVPAAAAEAAIAAGVELTIMSWADLEALDRVVRPVDRPIPLQLCVETGMARGGLPVAEVARVAARIASDTRFSLAGVWSHLASPHDPEASRAQLERFDRAVEAIRAAGLGRPELHVATSGSIFGGTAPPFDLVRPGLAVYGLLDADLPITPAARSAAAQLRPAMALKATAVAFVDVEPGGEVGYGGRWRAARASRVAILPLGYGDGYLRHEHPEAAVLVRGARAPLAGVISMDGVAVDVTDVPDVGYDEPFVLLGEQGDEAITATELARWRNTIVWEVLSSMAPRLDRVYYPEAGGAARVASGDPEHPLTRSVSRGR